MYTVGGNAGRASRAQTRQWPVRGGAQPCAQCLHSLSAYSSISVSRPGPVWGLHSWHPSAGHDWQRAQEPGAGLGTSHLRHAIRPGSPVTPRGPAEGAVSRMSTKECAARGLSAVTPRRGPAQGPRSRLSADRRSSRGICPEDLQVRPVEHAARKIHSGGRHARVQQRLRGHRRPRATRSGRREEEEAVPSSRGRGEKGVSTAGGSGPSLHRPGPGSPSAPQ